MSDRIRMTHPDLPDAEYFARPQAVEVREQAGWVVSPQDERPPAPIVDEQPVPVPEPQEPASAPLADEPAAETAALPAEPATPQPSTVEPASPAKKKTPARAGDTQES